MMVKLSIAGLALTVLVAAMISHDRRRDAHTTNRATATSPASIAKFGVLGIEVLDPALVRQLVARFPDRTTNFARLVH